MRKGKREKSTRAPRVAAAPSAAPPPPGLVTARELREHLGGVPGRTLERWISEGLPVAYREPGRPNLFRLEEVDAWKAERAGEDLDDDRYLYGPGQSPMLEALRKEKLRELRFKNDVREGQLVEVATVSQLLHRVFSAVRAEFESMERQHGQAVGDAIRAAVERAQAACAKFKINGNGAAPEGGQPSA